uniref:Protein GOLM2 n=1 Tax=Tetraodon nigroviridis TaxID=99883 RepID=H3CVI3_TETNG
MIGFGGNRRGGRLPSFILIFLMVVIAILSFNYYTVSSRQGRLLDELAEVHSQVKRTDAARSRLEKRNSELMVQVDTHKKQMEQRDGDYSALESKLQAREALGKKCTDEKMKLQDDVTSQMTEIHRLKEQLTELKQELMKKEDQLREVKKNSTNLEKKLEYESLQCGRQMAQLKKEYEETKKTLEDEATKLRQNALSQLKDEGRRAEVAAERHTVAAHRRGAPDPKGTGRSRPASSVTDEMGKPGGDAGMPAIEDSEVGKPEDNQFGPTALRKPAITQKRHQAQEEPGPGPAEAPAGQGGGPSRGRGAASGQENNKAAIKADELGEQQRQIQGKEAPECITQLLKPRMRGGRNPCIQLPSCRFFDENESPVDPQHGSKLADYNGDDGNVGEYEADKQAELAYNEEEDGDGGEEDVQDDEDRDIQRERAVDYGKRHQAIDIL